MTNSESDLTFATAAVFLYTIGPSAAFNRTQNNELTVTITYHIYAIKVNKYVVYTVPFLVREEQTTGITTKILYLLTADTSVIANAKVT